jgi:hypothetical protein
MRLFRRGRAEDAGDEPVEEVGPAADADQPDAVEGISARRPGEAERARIENGLAELASAGIDIDDISALSDAFDAAVVRGDLDQLPMLAVGVGEHLHRHAPMRWAMITDAFGQDLGLEGTRRDIHVIPDSLLMARWMRRETNWLEGAVRHIADTSAR